MRKAWLLSLSLAAGSMVYGGTSICPDKTYVSIPIAGVTGGDASSCGWATVTGSGATASTPGNGTVAAVELSAYLEMSLAGTAPTGFGVLEGSAVKFAGFTAPANSQLSFSWESTFEEGGTGSLFYILNGSLTVLDIILPQGQGLPGASGSGTVTANLLTGANTFAFGAVTLADPRAEFATSAIDPQLSITNLAVTPNGGVPEPGTFGMLGLGLAGLAVLARRR